MNDQYILKTLSNAIEVLNLFQENETLTPKEIEENINMNRTNLYRILYTLRYHGLLELDPQTGEYRIGMKMVHFASLAIKRLDVKEISRPFLHSLKDTLQETIHLVVMNDYFATFIDKIELKNEINMGSYIGWNAPLYCTASGKLLLSYKSNQFISDYCKKVQLKNYTENTLDSFEKLITDIEEIRKRGYSIDNEEMVEGLTCFAVPIKRFNGEPVAAISVSGPTTRMKKNKDFFLECLFKTARDISEKFMKIPRERG